MLRLTLVLLIAPFLLVAQQYNFRSYSVSDGLAQSQVYAMAEDARGYLWVGTRGGGVSRFDGLQFTNFSEDDGLGNSFINCIEPDKKGNIWFGTDEGAYWYDGKRFNRFSASIITKTVLDIHFTRDGKTWIATGDTGLIIFNDTLVTEHLHYGNGLPSDRVYCIFEEADGTAWLGMEIGLTRIRQGKRKTFGRKDGLPVAGIRSITMDKNNTLWFATYGGGLCRLNRETEKFERFTTEGGLTNNTTHCMLTDRLGRIWVGTATGVTRIDDKKIKTFSTREGLCSEVVMSLLEDSWGNTWFGTSGGGACLLDGERFIHFNEKSGDMGTWIYALHCDRRGHIWFGTSSGGVTEYDGMYYTNYFEGAGFTSAKVRCFGEDTTGTIWFGTAGEGAYSLSGGSFVHYGRKEGMSSSFVNCFITDSLNRQWMGTAGGGINVYDPAAEKFIVIGKKEGLASDRILSFARDNKGNIWACSLNDGIFRMDYDSSGIRVKKQYTTDHGLPANHVRCATIDRYGNLWFGFAGAGIARFDGTNFHRYSKKDSLASNNIYLLIADENRNIWVGTEKGLDRLVCDANGKIISIKHFGKGEGLTGIETSTNAACIDTSGGVWFGTISGASVYYAENDYITTQPPKVHLTGIRLFFDPIQTTPYGSTAKASSWFAIPDSLVLPYTENHLRFEFTGIDLRNPEGVRFRWKLNGFDEKWSPENSERQATYSNLPPGEYAFLLQAKSSDGFWSKEQRFVFRITPPVWATWPFRLGVTLTGAVLIAFFFTWRLRVVQNRNKRQLEKVTLEKNLLELEQKALRLQMNPHFIFNALQSIQGFIARNDSTEARRYLAKFGKLMRLTLDSSRQSYTSIAEEAESLQHYLELEALCHGNRFTFSVTIDPRIHPEATFIPVMLIQPFVENAVLHGMRHLEEKQGRIEVRFLPEGKTIVCEIEDNGIGRTKAAEKEPDDRVLHKSAAMSITRERLAQKGENGEASGTLDIIDLIDAESNPAGTKVAVRVENVVWE
ncbi:MAG TPA: two-component regulator propeller domain-containing protein [Bacteroidia bacterium]|nr:two-component regulator propeller domain-containing protein [Bacteroidia bacterium]